MQIRTDLAMEAGLHAASAGISQKKCCFGKILKTEVTVETEEAARMLQKAKGHYITFSMDQLYYADAAERLKLSHHLAHTLRMLLPKNGDILVVGLGNRRITADALGSKVLDHLLVTRHLQDKEGGMLYEGLRGVCALAPGVLGVTGMETAEVIRGIVQHVKPSAVIAIDALTARESGRICTTIQVTNTGIMPGSGVGNHRTGLNEKTLGVPVIAIGVPMVVYATVIARDALELMMKDMGISQQRLDGVMDELLRKTLHHPLGDMVVTPREVDAMVGKAARIIGDGINEAVQEALSPEELMELAHDCL